MRIAAIAGSLVVLWLAAGAQASSLFNINLIKNPGAESDAGGDGYGILEPTGWVTSGNVTVVDYTLGLDGGFPSSFPGSGSNFFSGGPSNPSSSATQWADVSGGSSQIDLGYVRFTLSGYLGGWQYRGDDATLTVHFMDSMGNPLSSAMIGPVTQYDRSEATGFLFCETGGAVPAGTRSVEFILQMTRDVGGGYNNGYADNLAFVMTGQEVPPTNAVPLPAAAWMGVSLLGGVGGMGMLRRRIGTRR